MNQNRLIIGLAVAVLAGLLLSGFVYRVLKQASAVRPAPVTAHIVVAAMPIPLGTRLEEKNLRLIHWPASEPDAGMFTRIEDCANRTVIQNLGDNEPDL